MSMPMEDKDVHSLGHQLYSFKTLNSHIVL